MKLHESVARDAHVQLHVDFPVCGGALGRCSLSDTQVGVQRILPLDYSTMHLPPMIGVSRVDIPKSNQLAVLPLSSPVVAALREMEVSAPSMSSNVQVSLAPCLCGAFHVSLCTTVDLCRGDTLVPANSCSPRILVQFDGSAHRSKRIGGAGLPYYRLRALACSCWIGVHPKELQCPRRPVQGLGLGGVHPAFPPTPPTWTSIYSISRQYSASTSWAWRYNIPLVQYRKPDEEHYDIQKLNGLTLPRTIRSSSWT